MKIEDIKSGDVIVRTEDGMVNKVAEVTPDGLILRLAYTDMEKCFHVFLKPDGSKLTAEHYEPATEEQRQYMDSKLADFYGTNAEAASKRFIALATMMGDLKQENIELAERVKQLTDDNTRMAKRIDSARTLSDLTGALDKVEELERDRDFFKKEYKQGQRLYESLFNQHDLQSNELKAVREERDEAKEQYKELQHKYEELQEQYDTAKADVPKVGDTLEQLQDYNAMLRKQLNTANANCKEFEEKRVEADEKVKEYKNRLIFVFRHYRRFEHADFVSMGYDCPHYTGAEVEVGDSSCLGCAHFLKADFDKTKKILCAYNYDKEKEKRQEEDNFHRKMDQSLNS